VSEYYAQYGCGFSNPSGWRNFDASPTLRFEKIPIVGRLPTHAKQRFPKGIEYGDVIAGLPLPKASCRGVYCSHVLEHLALRDFRKTLQNSYELLVPGGRFRFVVPDLEKSIRDYVADDSDTASIRFLEETRLGREARNRSLRSFLFDWLGNSQHLWMWDFKSIRIELLAAGFVDVRRAFLGDSEDPEFNNVEDESRWEDALGVECLRPTRATQQKAA